MFDSRSLTQPERVSRRRFVQSALACTALATQFPVAQAEEKMAHFPRRPITLLVPWSAGGATDLSLRLLAELATHHLGQRVVVDNRPGAGGTLAMNALVNAAPDGYTIAQMPQTVFRAPWVQKLSWDPIRDTTPIVQISGVTFGVVVPSESRFTSIADVLSWARTHPGELTVATNGVGTTPHVVLDEWFEKLALHCIHVPYKGVSEQMMAVSSNQVMVGISANGFAPHVDGGRVRLLAIMAAKRSPRWPQVPTLKELGHGIVANSPYGLAGPKGMSETVVQVLHDVFKLAMHEPRHLAELAKYDQELAYLSTATYAQSMRSLYEQERKVATRLGLSAAKSF